MNSAFPKLARLLTIAAIAIVAGCGPTLPQGVVVKGKLIKAGQPLPVPRSDVGLGWVQLDLVPAGGLGTESSRTKDDGSFEFRGAGQGIAPGKYRLAVSYYDKGPPNDSLKGAFSAAKTPITIDVPQDKVGGTLDAGTIDLADHGAK
jgi:hypothetical protein